MFIVIHSTYMYASSWRVWETWWLFQRSRSLRNFRYFVVICDTLLITSWLPIRSAQYCISFKINFLSLIFRKISERKNHFLSRIFYSSRISYSSRILIIIISLLRHNKLSSGIFHSMIIRMNYLTKSRDTYERGMGAHAHHIRRMNNLALNICETLYSRFSL